MPKGSCWCKAITYTYSGTPAMKVLCHCLPCQKISSSAFTTNLFIPKSSLTITSETTPQSYTQNHPTGFPIQIFFCGKCATTVWKWGGEGRWENWWVVQAGTLDDEEEEGGKKGIDIEVPVEEYWTSNRACWLGSVDGLKQFEGFS